MVVFKAKSISETDALVFRKLALYQGKVDITANWLFFNLLLTLKALRDQRLVSNKLLEILFPHVMNFFVLRLVTSWLNSQIVSRLDGVD